jgi:hypothetical protein
MVLAPVGDLSFSSHTRRLVSDLFEQGNPTFNYHFTEEHVFRDLGAAGIPSNVPLEARGSRFMVPLICPAVLIYGWSM